MVELFNYYQSELDEGFDDYFHSLLVEVKKEKIVDNEIYFRSRHPNILSN